MQPGLPPGDFGSTVMLAEVEDRLVPTPWTLAIWNPYLTCGKPTIGFMSPFNVFELPTGSSSPS